MAKKAAPAKWKMKKPRMVLPLKPVQFKAVKPAPKITGKAQKPREAESKPVQAARAKKSSNTMPGSLRGWGPITKEID